MPYEFNPADVGRQVAQKNAAGITQMATDAQTIAGTRADRSLSPSSLGTERFQNYADVTLTSAQVKALATTQITLVAAPGAGKVLVFKGALLKLNYGTNVFAETADNLTIKYTDDSGAAASQAIELTGFIDQSADTYTNALPLLNTIVAATAIENQALVLDNINDNITGNAANDNTLTVRCFYQVATI